MTIKESSWALEREEEEKKKFLKEMLRVELQWEKNIEFFLSKEIKECY